MKNKTKEELAQLVNQTLAKGDVAGHLAALGNLDSSLRVTAEDNNHRLIKIERVEEVQWSKSECREVMKFLIDSFVNFLVGER